MPTESSANNYEELSFENDLYLTSNESNFLKKHILSFLSEGNNFYNKLAKLTDLYRNFENIGNPKQKIISAEKLIDLSFDLRSYLNLGYLGIFLKLENLVEKYNENLDKKDQKEDDSSYHFSKEHFLKAQKELEKIKEPILDFCEKYLKIAKIAKKNKNEKILNLETHLFPELERDALHTAIVFNEYLSSCEKIFLRLSNELKEQKTLKFEKSVTKKRRRP